MIRTMLSCYPRKMGYIIFTLQFGRSCFSFRTSFIRNQLNYFSRLILLNNVCNNDKFRTTINRSDRNRSRIIFDNKFIKIFLFYRDTFSLIQKLNIVPVTTETAGKVEEYAKTRLSGVCKNNVIKKRHYSTENKKSKSNDNIQAEAPGVEKDNIDDLDRSFSVKSVLMGVINQRYFGIKFPYILILEVIIVFLIGSYVEITLNYGGFTGWRIQIPDTMLIILQHSIIVGYLFIGTISILCLVSGSIAVIQACLKILNSLKETYKKKVLSFQKK